jgi:hypothetical protein
MACGIGFDDDATRYACRRMPGVTANAYDRVPWEGRTLLMILLDIEVPVIAAINCRTSCSQLIPRPSRIQRMSSPACCLAVDELALMEMLDPPGDPAG